MTLLSNFKPKGDGQLARWAREVRRILLASEGGISWADNIGATVTFQGEGLRLGSSLVTDDVAFRLTRPPAHVFVLNATPATGGYSWTGNAMLWKWENGTLTVGKIEGLTNGVTYTVTLGVMWE